MNFLSKTPHPGQCRFTPGQGEPGQDGGVLGTPPQALDEPSEFDPDGHLNELESLHRRALNLDLPNPPELYRRTSATLRVSCRGDVPGRDAVHVGRDEGLALRVRTRPGHVAFAASSGAGESSLAWLIDRCRTSPPRLLPEAELWDRGDPLRIDRDRILRLPSPAEARGWLSEATETLGPCVEAWVEVATTLESWVAGEGLLASRTRRRAWAFARPDGTGAGDGALPPLVVANRRWDELPRDGWARLAADRLPPGATATRLPSRCAVLFAPESAAVLVQALSRVLHGDPAAEGEPVGPGWRLFDDPTDETALFGGTFDDARFPTRRVELADGRRISGSTYGPGCYRRPAFRDEPVPMPANIVVEPGPEALPRWGVLVSQLSVHPLGPLNWVLVFDGAVLDRGLPGARIRAGRISISPTELVGRCVGTYGTPEAFRQGVRTPALLFDDIALGSQAAAVSTFRPGLYGSNSPRSDRAR